MPDGLTCNTATTTAPEITVFSKAGGHLSKVLVLGSNGELLKDSAGCRMSSGRAFRWPLGPEPATALAGLITTLEPHHAIALGMMREGIGADAEICCADTEQPGPGRPIARSAKNLAFAAGQPAFMLLDVDTKGAPQEVRDSLDILGIEGVVGEVVPALWEAARVWRASTSAGLFVEATGQPIGDTGGSHLYVQVADGADIPRALPMLAKRLWLAGYGWIALSRSGALLNPSTGRHRRCRWRTAGV